MTKASYDLETVQRVVTKSKSMIEVLKALGLQPMGGNYATLKRYITKYGLDTSHFEVNQAWAKGKKFGPKRPLTDYFEGKAQIASHALKLRLINNGILEHKCVKCNLTTWLGQPISLELEHKDGDHSNNKLENLELLCPNCHAQTSTYRGRKLRKKDKTLV